MLSIESLMAFTFASVLLAIVPGPDNIFVLTQSAIYGRRSGIWVTLGLCTGLVVHTTAVALGVAAIFQASEVAFSVLKYLGAAYLLYLAWQAFRASSAAIESNQAPKLSAIALYRRGIIMNVTNPKVSIFFLAFLPQFADPERGSVVLQLFALGGVFMMCALIMFSGFAILAGSLGKWLTQSPKAQVYMNRMAGTVFTLLALKLASASSQ